MPPEGLDAARDAFAAEVAPAERPRDQQGRFVQTSSKPEPIFAPREVEGDDDAGADPRYLEHERRVADGRAEEGDEAGGASAREGRPKGKPLSDQTQIGRPPAADAGHRGGEGERQEPEGQDADAADQDGEGADKRPSPEGDGEQDAEGGLRYKVQIDGEEREVSLRDALNSYAAQETINHRVSQMVEVAKQIDQRGLEATQARDAYIEMCRRQEQEFAALIPQEPQNWEQLYQQDPAAAHRLEANFKAVYGTLNQIRARRVEAEQQRAAALAQHTAQYSQAEFAKFCSRNKLTDQGKVDSAIAAMRKTALSHGFSEDEIGTTYDERMLSVLHKAAKYDAMIASRPPVAQPERPLQPGSAPRVGNGAARMMNDAQRRLAASGRVDDAAMVMAQLIGRR